MKDKIIPYSLIIPPVLWYPLSHDNVGNKGLPSEPESPLNHLKLLPIQTQVSGGNQGLSTLHINKVLSTIDFLCLLVCYQVPCMSVSMLETDGKSFENPAYQVEEQPPSTSAVAATSANEVDEQKSLLPVEFIDSANAPSCLLAAYHATWQ